MYEQSLVKGSEEKKRKKGLRIILQSQILDKIPRLTHTSRALQNHYHLPFPSHSSLFSIPIHKKIFILIWAREYDRLGWCFFNRRRLHSYFDSTAPHPTEDARHVLTFPLRVAIIAKGSRAITDDFIGVDQEVGGTAVLAKEGDVTTSNVEEEGNLV